MDRVICGRHSVRNAEYAKVLLLFFVAPLVACSFESPSVVVNDDPLEKLLELKAELSYDNSKHVIGIDISERDIKDDDLPDLNDFDALQGFYAIYTSLDGSFLESLNQCTKLEKLHLFASPINDKGLAKLKDHPNLKDVNLGGTQISDKSLKIIASWKKLERLEVADTKLSSEGLTWLRETLPEVEID